MHFRLRNYISLIYNNMRITQFLAALIFATLSLTSCTLKFTPLEDEQRETPEYRDSKKWGKVIDRNIEAEKFCMIDADGTAEVIFTQADSCSIRAYGNEKAIEEYKFMQQDNTLSIRSVNSDRKRFTSKSSISTPAITVYVTAPSIEDIKIYGAATITLEKDIIQKRNLNIEINGLGDLEAESLEINNLTVTINGTGDLDIDRATCTGNAKLTVNGVGDINANVKCANAKTTVNGAGDIKLNIKCIALTTECNGAGDIKLKGECVTLNKKDGAVGAIDSRNLDVSSGINIK